MSAGDRPSAGRGGKLARRGLLGGMGIAALAGCASGLAAAAASLTPYQPGDAGHPDAALLALVAEYMALQHRYLRVFATVDDEHERDRLIEPFNAAQHALLPALIATRATTADGFLARARLHVLFAPEDVWVLEKPADYCADTLMLAALLRDMAGDMLRYRLRACDQGQLPAIVA